MQIPVYLLDFIEKFLEDEKKPAKNEEVRTRLSHKKPLICVMKFP